MLHGSQCSVLGSPIAQYISSFQPHFPSQPLYTNCQRCDIAEVTNCETWKHRVENCLLTPIPYPLNLVNFNDVVVPLVRSLYLFLFSLRLNRLKVETQNINSALWYYPTLICIPHQDTFWQGSQESMPHKVPRRCHSYSGRTIARLAMPALLSVAKHCIINFMRCAAILITRMMRLNWRKSSLELTSFFKC